VDKKEKKPYLMISPFHASREDKLLGPFKDNPRCNRNLTNYLDKKIAEENYGYFK